MEVGRRRERRSLDNLFSYSCQWDVHSLSCHVDIHRESCGYHKTAVVAEGEKNNIVRRNAGSIGKSNASGIFL